MSNEKTKTPFTIAIRVYYEDTDFSGIVYHANHLKFFERGRTEALRDLGVDQTALKAQGVVFVVTKVNANLDRILNEVIKRKLTKLPVSGIVITRFGREGDAEQLNQIMQHPYVVKNNIPILSSKLGTYDTMLGISQIEVKINTETPFKVTRAIELINNNVDVTKLF